MTCANTGPDILQALTLSEAQSMSVHTASVDKENRRENVAFLPLTHVDKKRDINHLGLEMLPHFPPLY